MRLQHSQGWPNKPRVDLFNRVDIIPTREETYGGNSNRAGIVAWVIKCDETFNQLSVGFGYRKSI